MLSEVEREKYRAKLHSSIAELTDDCRKMIGSKLQAARKRTGLTQADVSEIIGLEDPMTISRYERGVFKEIPFMNLYKLAAIYECNVIDFLPEDLARLTSPLASVNNESLNGMLSLLMGEQQRRAIM